ncbi:hypothetical protein ACA910_008638 [Epithemia clementina (nom. ined.)]
MACAEGGYRLIDLRVYYYNNSTPGPVAAAPAAAAATIGDDTTGSRLRSTNQKQEQQVLLVNNVEWTGADMMDLKSPHVRMRTQRLATGRVAAQMARQVFAGLLMRRQNQTSNTNDNDNNNNKNKNNKDSSDNNKDSSNHTTAKDEETKEPKDSPNHNNDNDNDNNHGYEGILDSAESVLRVFPDMAIVAGTMQVLLPIIDPQEKDLYDLMFANNNNENDSL